MKATHIALCLVICASTDYLVAQKAQATANTSRSVRYSLPSKSGSIFSRSPSGSYILYERTAMFSLLNCDTATGFDVTEQMVEQPWSASWLEDAGLVIVNYRDNPRPSKVCLTGQASSKTISTDFDITAVCAQPKTDPGSEFGSFGVGCTRISLEFRGRLLFNSRDFSRQPLLDARFVCDGPWHVEPAPCDVEITPEGYFWGSAPAWDHVWSASKRNGKRTQEYRPGRAWVTIRASGCKEKTFTVDRQRRNRSLVLQCPGRRTRDNSEGQSNNSMNPTIQPVTARAAARSAPGRLAGYAGR